MQDDRVNREPGERSAADADQIGDEPGDAGESNEVADMGPAIHGRHGGAGCGQPDADGEVGEPGVALELPMLPFRDDPERRDTANRQKRTPVSRPSPPARRHSTPTSK